METIQIPAVNRRRGDDPEPDLTAMYVIHRAMLGDLRRLAKDDGGQDQAVRRYVANLLVDIHHHHAVEDEVLWPIIERTAGQAVDLVPFSEDHHEVEALLARCRAALSGDLAGLRRGLGELYELLAEHIAEEEAEVFPIIKQYVPADAYQWVEDQVPKRAGARQLLFSVPWLASWGTREEIQSILARSGNKLRVMLALTRGRYRRLEGAAFSRPRPTL
ncbi:hemerythrin domain-containing protein [Nonomuraea polychroma]|uniref:hemerythrin domain-containing protein n=1 Tax=Nonomuraea polychroma TaxID=46176 RepID=UPI003D8DC699